MKLSKEIHEVVKTTFAHNPNTNVLFVTADNQAFDEAAKADSHAQRLKKELVVTVTRESFEAGEAALATERAQAGHTTVNTVDTIPMQIISTDASGTNDAGSALGEDRKEVKEELKDDEQKDVPKTADKPITVEKTEKVKATSVDPERTALVIEYTKLFGKKPSNLIGIEKLKTQIADKKAGK